MAIPDGNARSDRCSAANGSTDVCSGAEASARRRPSGSANHHGADDGTHIGRIHDRTPQHNDDNRAKHGSDVNMRWRRPAVVQQDHDPVLRSG